MKMQEWENPGRYLGIPAIWGRARSTALSWIKDRVAEKLQGWKQKFLSKAGKETLIKAVVQAIPSYAMSIVLFPKNFCAKLCSMVAKYWWVTRRKNKESIRGTGIR